jgi:hypothetical protein
MHLETLLYIAIQASNSLSPAPGYSIPDFITLARCWDATIAAEGDSRKMVIDFEATEIELGLSDDDEDLEDYDDMHVFGWDVESKSLIFSNLRTNENTDGRYISPETIDSRSSIPDRCPPY